MLVKMIELDETTSKYDLIGKIDINELKPVIIEQQKQYEINKEKEEQDRLGRKKLRLTKVVNNYLEIVDRDYILSKITDVETINNDFIVLKHDKYREHIRIILTYPINQLDIYHDKIAKDIDMNISILDHIKNIIPDGYRLYASRVKDGHDIVLRRGSYLCNDPCCFFLFCKNMFCYDFCCFCCLIEADIFPFCCCCIRVSGCC